MKVKSSLKEEKDGDKIVRRKGQLYRINKKNPRRKARQGKNMNKSNKKKTPKRKVLRKGSRKGARRK